MKAFGIIPARAGFTGWAPASSRSSRDHPRSRGVYAVLAASGVVREGSSPLARGLRATRTTSCAGRGIIPARAGFTGVRDSVSHDRGDHPRSRGVYDIAQRAGLSYLGSSPLARGLQLGYVWEEDGDGIIPARAGFTLKFEKNVLLDTDHPRSRGVYRAPASRVRCSAGSSPLARGLRSRTPVATVPAGIIPARAGFTATGTAWPSRCRDHPRSRGVYWILAPAGGRTAGSSPLARGLLLVACWGKDSSGIIPARAGFTNTDTSPEWNPADHPRSRGVYAISRLTSTSRAGSSPLARGLPEENLDALFRLGIIPARAGFTGR